MTYRPATRADLVPGAVFVVRRVDLRAHEFHVGEHVTLIEDDGSCRLSFQSTERCMVQWMSLEELERIHPPAADTVAIPREVAREFVRTRLKDGSSAHGMLSETIIACKALRDTILSADPTLLDPRPRRLTRSQRRAW